MVQGRWKPVQMTWHINRLELMAVRLTLLHFHEQVRGHRVLVRSDNSTTCYYINKFGGTRSQVLCCLTWDLMMWCSERDIELTAIHVPGVDNVLADLLSRQEINQREWSLHGHVTNMIFKIWGRPNIDLFASVHNHKLPVYCSLLPCPAALSRNAFSINWGCCWSSYAFPPPVLLHKVLQKICQDRARVILIAPMWPMRSWYSSILNMLVQSPLILPRRPDLLSQFKILHPKPHSFKLAAWRVSGIPSEHKVFLSQLLEPCHHPELNLPLQSTLASGQNLVAGAVDNCSTSGSPCDNCS